MRTHASAQLIGGRSHQCDATATFTVAGTRAYALLDGIGSNDAVRDWTRTYARHLARTAAHTGADLKSDLPRPRRLHGHRASSGPRVAWPLRRRRPAPPSAWREGDPTGPGLPTEKWKPPVRGQTG